MGKAGRNMVLCAAISGGPICDGSAASDDLADHETVGGIGEEGSHHLVPDPPYRPVMRQADSTVDRSGPRLSVDCPREACRGMRGIVCACRDAGVRADLAETLTSWRRRLILRQYGRIDAPTVASNIGDI